VTGLNWALPELEDEVDEDISGEWVTWIGTGVVVGNMAIGLTVTVPCGYVLATIIGLDGG
jgi:hypothetical protein